MLCENRFCVYQSQGQCILDEISIDDLGMCTDCIYPDIDEKLLEKAKNKILERYKEENECDF